MSLTLYYYPMSPPVRAVLLVAKALGVKLTLKHVDVMKGESRKPEFIEINPQHTVPTLVDEDLVICESKAIICYLVDKYAKNDSLYPKDPKKRAQVNQRLYFDAGTLHQSLQDYYSALFKEGQDLDPANLQPVLNAFSLLNTFLEGQQWVVCNQKTIADYAIAVTISNAEVLGMDLKKYPNIVSWFANVQTSFIDYEELNGNPAKKLAEYVNSHIAKKA